MENAQQMVIIALTVILTGYSNLNLNLQETSLLDQGQNAEVLHLNRLPQFLHRWLLQTPTPPQPPLLNRSLGIAQRGFLWGSRERCPKACSGVETIYEHKSSLSFFVYKVQNLFRMGFMNPVLEDSNLFEHLC